MNPGTMPESSSRSHEPRVCRKMQLSVAGPADAQKPHLVVVVDRDRDPLGCERQGELNSGGLQFRESVG